MFDAKKKAYLENRESLKQKMLASGPHSVIEVTPGELHIVLSGAMDGLIEEVEKERATDRHPMDGLSREADAINAEPDHKAHLERQVRREVTFEEAVKPLTKWMAENQCPHSHVVVSGVSAELFHGQQSFNTFEFVRD